MGSDRNVIALESNKVLAWLGKPFCVIRFRCIKGDFLVHNSVKACLSSKICDLITHSPLFWLPSLVFVPCKRCNGHLCYDMITPPVLCDSGL